MNSHNCPTPGTLTGTATNASEKTQERASIAVYNSIEAEGRTPLRFSSYAEKAAYYRGKVACTGSACDS